MIQFLRQESAALVIRRSVIALAGSVCAGAAGLILAQGARPHLHALVPPVDNRPTIIDGPPTNVAAAPPPVKLAPRVRHPPSELFAEENGDDEDYGDIFDAPPSEAAPTQAPQPAAQAPAQVQAQAQAQAPRGGPDRCARLASPADQMVCASPRLNAAEAALQRLYHMDLYRTWDPEGLREDQRRWRAVRDQVAMEAGPQGLAEFYAERIQELGGPY